MEENKHTNCDCDCGCGHEHHHGNDCGCGHDHAHEEINKKDFAFKVAVGGVLLVAGYILSELTERGVLSVPNFVYLICFGISYLIMGFGIIKEAVEGIIHGDVFNENFLMSIASLGAFAVGEYVEGCAVMFLFTIGEFLQSLAVQKSRKSIKDMLELKPQEVTIIRDGKEITVSPEAVNVGDIMIIRPGDKLDIDGVIVEGNAEIDMKALTGESIPVSKGEGDQVLAGSVNLDGAVNVKSTQVYNEYT